MTREEAIDIVRKNYPHVGVSGSQFETALRNLIPELRESEDEEIRKLLIWQVHRNIEDETNDLAQSVYDGIKGHDPDLEESIEDWKKCLAWLEKQKDHFRDDTKMVEQKPCEPKSWPADKDNLTQEQKPAEWSEEDERMIRCITNRIESDIQYGNELTKAYGNQDGAGKSRRKAMSSSCISATTTRTKRDTSSSVESSPGLNRTR